ncbi:MAG: DUF2231 domain-containing protein [Fibrella sp.]|nr:DUF2231 domain-containing protein [Armatimonadota bacterium]
MSVAFDLGALFFKKDNWRTVGFWTLVAGTILLVPAVASGLYGIYLDAGGKATFAAGGYDAERTIRWHRNMSFFATGFLVVPTVWRVVKRDDLANIARVACLLFAFVAMLFIAVTGYNGAYVPRGY